MEIVHGRKGLSLVLSPSSLFVARLEANFLGFLLLGLSGLDPLFALATLTSTWFYWREYKGRRRAKVSETLFPTAVARDWRFWFMQALSTLFIGALVLLGNRSGLIHVSLPLATLGLMLQSWASYGMRNPLPVSARQGGSR